MFAKINNLIYHFEGNKGKFKIFLRYSSLKTKGNYYRCPTKDAENCQSIQAEHRALEDVLANSTDCLLAVSFGETFHRLHQ